MAAGKNTATTPQFIAQKNEADKNMTTMAISPAFHMHDLMNRSAMIRATEGKLRQIILALGITTIQLDVVNGALENSCHRRKLNSRPPFQFSRS